MADDKTFTQAEVDAMIAEQTKGLKEKRDELLTEANRAKAALKNYDGVDPVEYKALKDAAADAERKKATADGDFKALEKQLIDRHTAELGVLNTRIGTLTSALEQRLIDADLSSEIASAKGSVKGLLPHARPHLKVVEVDGQFVAQVVDARGNQRIADGKGTPMTPRDLVEELKRDPELAPMFAGSGSTGGGATKTATIQGPGTIPAEGQAFLANIKGIKEGTVKVAVP